MRDYFNLSKCIITKYVIHKLSEENNISLKDAYAKFAETATFELLQDREIELAAKPPQAVYEMLQLELQGKIEEWEEYGME